jgi:hypothetical protein
VTDNPFGGDKGLVRNLAAFALGGPASVAMRLRKGMRRFSVRNEAEPKCGRALATKPDWHVDLSKLTGLFESGDQIKGIARALRASARSSSRRAERCRRRIYGGRDALRGNIGAVCKADFPFDHRDAIEALAFALVRQLEMAKAFRGQIESTMKPP